MKSKRSTRSTGHKRSSDTIVHGSTITTNNIILAIIAVAVLLIGSVTLHQALQDFKSWGISTSRSKKISSTLPQRNSAVAETAVANAATGSRFPGSKVRDFPSNKRQTFGTQLQRQQDGTALQTLLQNQSASLRQQCDRWAVVTTIYEPSDAVVLMGNEFARDWCMVVVADTKTPVTYMSDPRWNTQNNNVVFLSVNDQNELAQLVPFIAQTPYRSFARKNIGYLYAVWKGAKVIFDFDDDNLVRTNVTNADIMVSGTELLQQFSKLKANKNGRRSIMARKISMAEDYTAKAFNPFPKMGASLDNTWPRGLPLSLINDESSRGQPGPLMVKDLSLDTNVAVIQSVCDHDPDVDAIYRLTRPLPFTFDAIKTFNPEKTRERPKTLQVPTHLYAPYNAQATLHYPIAYWGLYLPMTVTGRVSDIWRSYIVQRLLRELKTDASIMYSAPLVTQYRNAHDYVGDFVAEGHLYHRTEALLDFLDEWTPSPASNDNLQTRIEDLWIQLYERQYIEMDDVQAVQEWLSALQQGGYIFPEVRDHSKSIPDVSKGGVEARQECARQQLEHWKEPVPTYLNGSNYGALTIQNGKDLTLARMLAEYEVDHPFPHSVDLLCRTGGRHSPHELAILVESIQLYWPKCAGRVVVVLDLSDDDFAHENLPDWIDVYYSDFDYGMPGRLGNQLFNMYSDQQGQSEYVAIIDSDVALVTPVTPNLIFNMDKKDEKGNAPPYVLADTEYQKGFWRKGDEFFFLNESNGWNFMVTLPSVWPRLMFPQYRAFTEALYNNEFETTDLWQHFRVTVHVGWMAMSQFCLLGNWLVRHWKDSPFDLRLQTDEPTIRYGVHLSAYRKLDFRPGGKNDPASFQSTGRRVIADGICELFCSALITTTNQTIESRFPLENCPSLCPSAIQQPREMLFRYEVAVHGTPEQRNEVSTRHFEPLKSALVTIYEKNTKRR